MTLASTNWSATLRGDVGSLSILDGSCERISKERNIMACRLKGDSFRRIFVFFRTVSVSSVSPCDSKRAQIKAANLDHIEIERVQRVLLSSQHELCGLRRQFSSHHLKESSIPSAFLFSHTWQLAFSMAYESRKITRGKSYGDCIEFRNESRVSSQSKSVQTDALVR
jgi:hypothetical protein